MSATNNKQCPVCRSLLTSSSCRKCGYQEKKLKIVHAQDQFAGFNFINRLRRTQNPLTTARLLAPEEKLKLYLRQYIKLLKQAAAKVAAAYALPFEFAQRLNDTVFQIWKAYLLRRKELGLAATGMFKSHVSSRPKINNKKKKTAPTQQEDPAERSDKELDSSQEERQEANKKRAADAASAANAEAQPKDQQLEMKHKFRSYYIVSVKPLIRESVEQRRVDASVLTSSQKSFLSYLLAASEVNQEFVRMCSQRYLRLVLQLGGRRGEKSYVREGEIEQQLFLRSCGTLQKKEDCLLLMLLVDLLWCFDSQSHHLASSQQLADLLALYEKCDSRSEVIDSIISIISKPDRPDAPNVPDITFELIYTIVNLASMKIGLCLTISEVIAGCGSLEIPAIAVDDETSLEGVSNEEAIAPTKIRKNSHLLACFLDLTGEVLLTKWCEKWCNKLQLQSSAKQVALVAKLIFTQLIKGEPRGDGRGQFLAEGRVVKYRRYFWIEQDLACLAAIVIFLKLATGVTNYPFLVNFPLREISQCNTVEDQEFKALSSLLQSKSILLNNTSTNLLKKLVIPQLYLHQISLISLSRTVTQLSARDKAFQAHSLNKAAIRFRNLSHLNGMSSVELTSRFAHIKETAQQPKDQIQMKYEEILHKQFTRELADRYKRLKFKKPKETGAKPSAKLNANVLRQLECIVRERDVLVAEGQPVATEECVVDEPSCNYELQYEYNEQSLRLSRRSEQLYLMQALCLNLCSFPELAYWLGREQAVLRCFEG